MIIIISAAAFLAAAALVSGPAEAEEISKLPTFVSAVPNLNDFGRFADGGPDENWYIGFNNAWIVKLPPAPQGNYTRAYIGAKVGRAKSRAKAGRAWDREAIPGKIYMAISNRPAFSSEQSFFLVEAADIPLEPDPRAPTPGAGQAQWFWAQVPTGHVNIAGPNYLTIWSTAEHFVQSSSAPILAAAEAHGASSGDAPIAWVNRSIQGVPPRRPEGALETPLNNLLPALALKLVPENDAQVLVHECTVETYGRNRLFTFSVEAEDSDLAWLEYSTDQFEWERFTRHLRRPPYAYTLTPESLPSRGAYVRASARDFSGNEGHCDGVFIGPNGVR